MAFRKIFLVTTICGTSACTHPILLDQDSKNEIEGCEITVEDRRVDRQIITPQPGTTYSYPIEYPIDQAIRNKLCQSSLYKQPITAYLEHAKCEFTMGLGGKWQAAVKVTIKDYGTPAVSIEDGETESSMVGKACGERVNRAIDNVVSQIVGIVE